MSGLLENLGLGPRLPRELAFRPAPLWIGDAAAGRRLLSGTFRLAGQEVRAAKDAGPWRLQPPTPAFEQALHDFAWLDDLAADGTREARRLAQSWVFGWIARHGDGEGPGWGPETAGRRALHWLERSEFLLHGASDDLNRRFLRALHQHARRLRRAAETAPGGLPRLRAATGHLYALLATEPDDAPRLVAIRRMGAAAELAVDADGGLASRNPEQACEALILLAGAARHLREAGLDPAPGHLEAMHRAQSALRALRLRDGGLPRFHGGGPGKPGRLDHALSLAHARKPGARPEPYRDRAMGFVKLSAGRVTVAVDAAPPPPGPEAHAATLAFELACGAERPICNCGPAAGLGGEWADACRATAAQTALSIEGVSSSRIKTSRRVGPQPFAERPSETQAETAQDLDGAWFLGAHDGYLSSHGLAHRRRLFLSPDGRDFRGEDVLEAPTPRARARFAKVAKPHGAPGLPFALHFHLHPDADVRLEPDGGVSIRLPESRWRFTTSGGGAAELRDSVHFDPESAAPRPSRQIVVTAHASEGAGRVVWGFQRG